MTIQEFRKIANPLNRYAWPGGYPTYAVTADGAALCHPCLSRERRSILEAITENDTRSGWFVEALDINWEDAHLYCDHCSDRIESAYAEDEGPLDEGDIFSALESH